MASKPTIRHDLEFASGPMTFADEQNRPELKKVLNGWQIFFITLSAVIGTGIFSHDGLALSITGPGGILLATGVVGLIAISFMDGLSEMIQAFPCSNALVEYVHAFVDHELAICVGLAYWATWAIFFALQLATAADYCSAWTLHKDTSLDLVIRVTVFYIFFPILLLWINTRNVSLFGWIETGGGFIKLLAISALTLVLYYLAGINEAENSNSFKDLGTDVTIPDNETYLADGFTHYDDFPQPVANVFAVMSVVAFSWIGIEIVAVTAFEASTLQHLKLPSQRIPYVTFLVYLVCGIGSAMCVRYTNSALSRIYRGEDSSYNGTSNAMEQISSLADSGSLVVIAANQVGYYGMANVFNGFLIFSALSAGNTGLYVASRTLYGLAFHDERKEWWLRNKLAYVNSSGVPMYAVIVSALAFAWVPFLGLSGISAGEYGAQTQNVNRRVDAASSQFLNTAASLSAIFVWATQCLAFIRYYWWLNKHRGKDGLLERAYPELNRWNPKNKIASTLLGFLQPGVAYVGFFGTTLIFLVFPSALWWGNVPNSPSARAFEVLETYLAPGLILCSWLILKGIKWWHSNNGRISWYVKLDEDPETLDTVLKNLKRLSEEQGAGSHAGSWPRNLQDRPAMQQDLPDTPGTAYGDP